MPAPGEQSLTALLRTLKTSVSTATYVFLTIPLSSLQSILPAVPLSSIQMLFCEREGVTLIVDLETANQYFPPDQYERAFESKMVTLDVHSSLEAVGFMAKITERLTREGISANPVSGYLHDHLFVPLGSEGDVMRCLGELREEALKD